MALPRHNVPQYMGNAVWDGNVLDLSSAVKAMLGDPFAFAVAPEVDALRTLLTMPNATARERAGVVWARLPDSLRSAI